MIVFLCLRNDPLDGYTNTSVYHPGSVPLRLVKVTMGVGLYLVIPFTMMLFACCLGAIRIVQYPFCHVCIVLAVCADICIVHYVSRRVNRFKNHHAARGTVESLPFRPAREVHGPSHVDTAEARSVLGHVVRHCRKAHLRAKCANVSGHDSVVSMATMFSV